MYCEGVDAVDGGEDAGVLEEVFVHGGETRVFGRLSP